MYNVNNCDHECDCQEICKPAERIFAAKAPYPTIQICERNRLYGQMMLDNMGGPHSEMSTISLYIYNNLLIDCDKSLADIFHKISIVEMHHLHIFGGLARLMGENPRLWTHRGKQMVYWSPSYNEYPMILKPLLVNALEGEKMAVQKYEHQCGQIKDIHIVDCLQRIIEDEKIHVEIFESLYDQYCN